MQHDINVTALPEVSAPSISSCAVLLELSISEIRGSKIDKRATKAAMIQYNVQNPKDVQVTKNRFAGNKMLEAINKIVRVARTDLKAMTLAWGKMGHRIIPVAAIPQIAAHFSELENRYWELVLGHDVRAYDEQGLAYTKHEAGCMTPRSMVSVCCTTKTITHPLRVCVGNSHGACRSCRCLIRGILCPR